MTRLDEVKQLLQSNPQQWEAFEEPGHCVVLAPPGSGKTQLLTAKLADSVARQRVRPPRGVACITMTNEAAGELRRRLASLGLQTRSTMFVGTVHGFAFSRIVSPFAALAGFESIKERRLATPQEDRACRELALEAAGFRGGDRRNALSTMNVVRQRLDLSGNPLLGGPRIAALAEAFETTLATQGVYDYNTIIATAVSLVEDNQWIARAVGAAFAEMYVDEYQDLAPGLDRIVRAITLRKGSKTRLFAVGDPDQAIYAFSGAHPELLNRLAAEEGIHRVVLERNYRNGQGIIDSALAVLGQQRVIQGTGAGGAVVVHAQQATVDAQVGYTVELVRRAIKEGTSADQIAVVSPWGSDRDALAAALRNAAIPVFARSDENWRTTPLTSLVETASAWISQRHVRSLLLSDIVPLFRQFISGGDRSERHTKLRTLIGTLIRHDSTSLAWDFVQDLTGLLVDGGRGLGDDDVSEYERLRFAISPGGPLAHMTVEDMGKRARAVGHVLASTIHASKGLEFDVVIISGADNAALPGFNPTSEEVAEGRRKLYVSITRARKHVDIVYCASRISSKGNPYRVEASPLIRALASQQPGNLTS
ncbi:UvrD-helicase domain-containing protein [Modestobacter sp. SYSU DS0290]